MTRNEQLIVGALLCGLVILPMSEDTRLALAFAAMFGALTVYTMRSFLLSIGDFRLAWINDPDGKMEQYRFGFKPHSLIAVAGNVVVLVPLLILTGVLLYKFGEFALIDMGVV